MRDHRLWVNDELNGDRLTLEKRRAHYLKNVLRLSDGDSLSVFNGSGLERQAVIDRAELQLGEVVQAVPESPLRIDLLQGISRGERMDTTIQKSTELGVHRVVPLLTARCEVKLNAARTAKRLQHWRNVAISACEQCGRALVPEIEPPQRLAQYLALPLENTPRVVLTPGATTSLSAVQPSQSLAIAVGPEGGFDPEEITLLTAGNFQPIGLGPRTLRTETAGAAAVAVAQSLWGDLA